MLFSLAVALMVLLVAAFWVYQGLFNGVLMLLCSIVACMVAFGFYEDLHSVWSGAIGPGLGLPLALILIFLVTLFALRFITDKLIPDGVHLPVVVDFAGGGVAGFFTGMVVIGTALVAAQMAPIGSSVFGFDRISADPQGVVVTRSLMLKPDNFTIGLVNMLSNGRFGGDNPFAKARPDLLTQLYSARAATQVGESYDAPAESLKIVSCREVRRIDEVTQSVSGADLKREFAPKEAAPANKFLVCKVRIDASAAPLERKDIRFRLPQFRLLGPPPSDNGPSPKAFLASAMSDIYIHHGHNLAEVQRTQPRRLVRFGPQTDFLLAPDKTSVVAIKDGDAVKAYRFEVAFEVPEDFTPWYAEFKHGAKFEITKSLFKEASESKAQSSEASTTETVTEEAAQKEESEEAEDRADDGEAGANENADASVEEEDSADSADSTDSDEEPKDKPPAKTAKKTSKPKVGQEQGGALNVADATQEGTDVTNLLPIPLDRTNNLVSQALAGSELGDGHFWLELSDEAPPEKQLVTQFRLPEGKKMLQLGAERNEALSMYGRAMNYASTVAAQIKITTADDHAYFAQGVYSIAKINGKTIVEIQYHPDADVPERCLAKPKKLTPEMMKRADPKERKFGYLFIVDPGIKITGFSSGGKGGKQQLDIDVPE
jgi:hypothetical protein